MIDLIASIAKFLGIDAQTLGNAIKNARERLEEKALNKRKEREATFATNQAICELIGRYYGLEDAEGNWRRYGFLVNQQAFLTTVYTNRSFLSLNRAPLDIPMTLHQQETADPDIAPEVQNYAPVVYARLEQMGAKLWPGPTYRLLDHGTDQNLHFLFSMTDFVKFRLTTGLLPYELSDALADYQGRIDDILANAPSALTVRGFLLPDLLSLIDFRSRICVGGIGVVFALARGAPDNDFVIPIQIRSDKVSDTQGQYALLPKATHQPIVGAIQEVNVHWTIFREVFEEVFGGEEAESGSKRMKFDWYFDEHPALEYFRSHEGTYNLEITGYGINAIGGNYDLATLLAVRWCGEIITHRSGRVSE